MRKSSAPRPMFDIGSLEAEHRALKERVAELGRRIYLNAEEQQEAARLKRRKLAVKDALEGMRRQTLS